MATTGLLPPKNYISAFDPRSIEGCTLWIDASDPAGYTKNDATGVVTQIFDKTGVNTIDFSTGNDWRVAVQTGTVKFNGRPVFVNTAGGPSTSKLGTISGQTINTGTISDITLNVVYTSFVANTGTTTANGMLFDSTNNIGVGVMSNGMLGIHNGTNADQNPTTNFSPVRPPIVSLSSGTTVVFTSGGFGSIQIGFGTTIINTSDTLTLTTFGSEITIGGNIGGTVPWVGCIAEIICHKNTLTFDQQLQIDGYLYAKWGGSLPTTHPYTSTTFKSRVPPFLRPFFPPNEIGDVKCLFWFDASDASTVSGSGTSMIWTDKSGNGNNITAWSGGTQTYSSSNRAMTLPAGSIGTIVNNIALTSQTAYSGFAVLTWPTSTNAPHDGRGIYLRPISTPSVTSTTGLAFGVNRMWYGAPIVTYTAGDPAAPIKYVTITTASSNGVPFQTAFAGNPTSTGGLSLGGLTKNVVGERLPIDSLTMSSATTSSVFTNSTLKSNQSAGTTNNLYTNRLPYFTDIDPSFGTTLTGGQMSQGGTAIQTFACAPTALTKAGTTASNINPMGGTKLVIMWSRDTEISASSSVNGRFSTIATGSHRASTAAQTYRIGNPVTSSTTAGQLTTGVTYDLHEVMFFDSSITSYTYKKIEAYLAHKWGTVNTSSNAALNTFNSGPLAPFYKFPPQVVTPFNPITTRPNPSQDTSLVAWYDASDSGAFTLSGANVSTWKDKSGKTADWTISFPSTNVVRSSGTLVNGIPTLNVSPRSTAIGTNTATISTVATPNVSVFVSMCATASFTDTTPGVYDIITTGGSSLLLEVISPSASDAFKTVVGSSLNNAANNSPWEIVSGNLTAIIGTPATNRNQTPVSGSLICLSGTFSYYEGIPANPVGKVFVVTSITKDQITTQSCIKAIRLNGMTVADARGADGGAIIPAMSMGFGTNSPPGRFYSNANGATSSLTGTAASGSSTLPNIYFTSLANGTLTNFKDGANSGSTVYSTFTIPNNTVWSLLSGYKISGNVNEILFFNITLTTFQRQQIEGYLAWKWGSNSLLATTHPYYKIRP